MLGSSRRLWTLMCSEEKGVVDDGGEFGLGINLLELAGLVDDLVGALVNVAASPAVTCGGGGGRLSHVHGQTSKGLCRSAYVAFSRTKPAASALRLTLTAAKVSGVWLTPLVIRCRPSGPEYWIDAGCYSRGGSPGYV